MFKCVDVTGFTFEQNYKTAYQEEYCAATQPTEMVEFFEWFYLFKHFMLSHLDSKELTEEERSNAHGPLTRELTAAWAEFASGKEDIKKRSERESLLTIGTRRRKGAQAKAG